MKKILILFALCTLFTGCQKTNQDNTNKENTTGNTKTNEVLCSITSTISKYEIDNRTKTSIGISAEEVEARKNSSIAVNYEAGYLYNFTEDGTKLLNYYEIKKYEYIIDYDMESEKEYYSNSCDKLNASKYKDCKVELADKTITVKYEINLDNEGYKNMAATLTEDKLIKNYKEDEMYTCTTN